MENQITKRQFYSLFASFFMGNSLALAGGISKGEKIDAIGISCGGPLDSKKGIIMCPPNLPDWDNVPLVELTEAYDLDF